MITIIGQVVGQRGNRRGDFPFVPDTRDLSSDWFQSVIQLFIE